MNFEKIGVIKYFNPEDNFGDNLNNLIMSLSNTNFILFLVNGSNNFVNIDGCPENIKVFNSNFEKTLPQILNEYISLMYDSYYDIDLVTFIDDGIILNTNWIEPLITAFKKYPRLSISTPNYCEYDEFNVTQFYCNWWFNDDTILPKHYEERLTNNTFLPLFKKSTFTISRDGFSTIGPFNTDYKNNLYDVDYSIRTTLSNMRIVSCVESIVLDTKQTLSSFLVSPNTLGEDLKLYRETYSNFISFNKIQPLTAVECQIYNQDHLLEAWLKNVHQYVDEIVILYAEEPWNHNPNAKSNALPVDTSIEILKEYSSKYPNLSIIHGDWKDETFERNYGLEFAKSKGAKWLLIIDCDELYDKNEIFNAYKFMLDNPKEIWVMNSVQLVKEKGLAALPKEGYPLCNFAIDLDSDVKFLATRIVAGESILIPYDTCKCWHFSYLLPKVKLEQKLNTSFHFSEFNNNWYRDIWPNINISSVDCHPTHPDAWHTMYNIEIPDNIIKDIDYLKD